ncbi:Late embryogenesis abundant protein [Parasponia andersonii]|uniref:Late embryogenesis abundant protein n=1 Tax=Parasponia andersonii TaxID=3476 RepID=A0A2P5B0V8_PARAD|nr:Late embryogenesis abundant protein [Parasponia andersonii]
MVKVHPQSNGPQLPPPLPPPPPRKHCCCVLFQFCFFLLAASFCLLLVAVLILAIIFGSRNEIQVLVTDASLASFDLNSTTNDTLLISYDMSFDVTLTNPNTRIAVYYDVVQAYAYYASQPFAAVTLAPFYQRRKTTKTLRLVFEGNETLSFDNDTEFLTWFGEEKRDGVYSITVVLDLSVRTKYGKIKYRQNSTYIHCYLRVPLSSVEGKTLYSTFEATQCGIVHIIN